MVAAGAGFAVTGALSGCAATQNGAAGGQAADGDEAHEEEVSPAEDLMREHGVLNRVLLVYEEGVRRLDAKEPLGTQVLARGASLVRRFVEDYREKLEEEHLVPRFERAGQLVSLVGTLRA